METVLTAILVSDILDTATGAAASALPGGIYPRAGRGEG